MEGLCPPHYSDMRATVKAVCRRKFGPGGPFHPENPGPWQGSRKVRSAAQVHNEEFVECIALQAYHLDLEFYDTFYEPGAYLRTHAKHMDRWHP